MQRGLSNFRADVLAGLSWFETEDVISMNVSKTKKFFEQEPHVA